VCCLDAIANLPTLQQVTAYRVPLLMSARASTRTSSWCLSIIARVTTGFFITALIQPLKGKNLTDSLERQHRERLQKTGGNMIKHYDPMTFSEIAIALNLSRPRVEQIYKKAIKKLQANPDTQILTDFLPEQPNESTNRNNRHYDRY
jgi:hypothetical protein